MGLDYALVLVYIYHLLPNKSHAHTGHALTILYALDSHLKYTIPPAIALTALYRPLLTSLDVYKLLFLITVSLV